MCIYCNTNNYRKIYENHYGPIPIDEQSGRKFDIHHKDGNHFNNDPANLIALSRKDHYLVHYDRGDYDACLRMSGGLLLDRSEIDQLVHDIWTPERRAKMSRLQKERMKDPAYVQSLITPERRKKAREAQLAFWQDHPERREQWSQMILDRMADPNKKSEWLDSVTNEDYRNRQSRLMKDLLADPARRAKIGSASKEFWSRPGVKESHIARLKESHQDPIKKAARIKGLLQTSQDPEQKQKLSKQQQKRMEENPKLKESGSRRFSEMNKLRNSQEHICPHCQKIGKGPGFKNHINACKKRKDE